MKTKWCHCSIPLAGYSTTNKSRGFVSKCQRCGKWPRKTHKSLLKGSNRQIR